jgi:hypothetical protein
MNLESFVWSIGNWFPSRIFSGNQLPVRSVVENLTTLELLLGFHGICCLDVILKFLLTFQLWLHGDQHQFLLTSRSWLLRKDVEKIEAHILFSVHFSLSLTFSRKLNKSLRSRIVSVEALTKRTRQNCYAVRTFPGLLTFRLPPEDVTIRVYKTDYTRRFRRVWSLITRIE